MYVMGLLKQSSNNSAKRIDGKVVLLTGGSKGLGLLLAREFGRLGGSVVLLSRNREELEIAHDRLTSWGIAHVDARVCDVRNRDAVATLIRDVNAGYGGIDILVNNAGVIEVGPLDALHTADFENAMDTMFWGLVTPTLTALENMRRRRSGTIVNITSVGGKVSFPHLLPYASAKFAALGFSEGLRAELAGTGIDVVTVVPGLTRTGSFLNALFSGQTSREFAWFSLGSSLPLISMDAERAARRIVRATLNREAELIMTPLANVGARLHGLMPGTSVRVMSVVARLLTSSRAGYVPKERGDKVMQQLDSRALKPALTLGMRAAKQVQPPETVAVAAGDISAPSYEGSITTGWHDSRFDRPGGNE
jgi:short-subunit dehydrogenase